MKKYLLAIVASIVLFGCENSQNYSVQLQKQREKIQEYFVTNNIKLLEQYPADSVFADNEFLWKGQDSIAFRLMRKGVGDTIVPGDRLYLRWVRYSLENSDSVSYWTTSDINYPLELTYDPDPNSYFNQTRSNTNCIGWQSAIRQMQRSDAVAEIIVPSPIGTLDAFNAIKAYRYKLTFKVLPK